MFITRLEMSGFKSFASKTSLDFRPGVMSVVGPNGCGKTNIVDAVRWVLGEQRTGALRAERMEAVIFNGTAKRRPVGMSEVTLTVENDRGVLPSAFTQVEITRRLFRSGESEYLINRTPSRLRDIQDLFVDTGFGHSTYSIIELSMVEGIISGPSEARRSIFEEAAGVAKFKSRRNAAERRLESTREALDRLKDVYGEVEKSYLALKRQSNRARRYQSLSKALQLRLLVDLSRERLQIVSRRLPNEKRLSEIEKIITEAESSSHTLSTEFLTLEAAEISLDNNLGRTQDTLKRIERREAELDGELALVKQRLRQLETEAENSIRQRAELKSLIETHTRTENEAKAESARLSLLKSELEQDRKKLDEEAKAINGQLSLARADLEEHRVREADLRRRLSTETAISKRAAEERSRFEASLSLASQRMASLTKRASELKESKAAADEQIKLVLAAVTKAREEREATSKALEIARNDHSSARSAQSSAQSEADAVNRELEGHRSRGAALTGLPVEIRKALGHKEILTIAARIHSEPEHRAAIAAALRPILDAIDADDLSGAIDLAGKLGKGEAALLRVETGNKNKTNQLKLPAGLTPLESLIVGNEPLDDFLRSRLSDCYLVQDRQAILSHSEWATANGVRLVTASGELLDPDGILYVGSLDPTAFKVGWQSRLKELEKNSGALAARSASSSERLKKAESVLAETEKRFSTARLELQKSEDELAAVKRKFEGIVTDTQQTELRLKEASEEEERLKEAGRSLPQPDSNDSMALKKLGSDLDGVIEAKEKASTKLAAIEAAQRRITESITANAAESARTTERLIQTNDRIANSVQTIETSTRRLGELEAKSAGFDDEKRRSSQAAENIEAQLDLVHREKTDSMKGFEAARSEKALKSARKQAVSTTLKQTQETLKKVIDERNTLELEAVSGRERLREIDRRLVEDAATQPEAIVPDTPERAEEELKTIELADLSLDQIKVRIQSLGPVNMLALEELEQVEERYRFLTDQRKDLEGGVSLLTETIDRINHEARRRFRETFEQVDANFQHLFRTLFEGGEARITLEGGDPLEADIRIWATPTGKKLQGLPMLSGGEKALTAISLLFAIYMVRPSPFCILDEVDAPLDDSNVGRFNRLIREFAVNTQFLIVTHNKRTMEAADNLFGVTLSEDGTSQLVSVRLEKTDNSPPSAIQSNMS